MSLNVRDVDKRHAQLLSLKKLSGHRLEKRITVQIDGVIDAALDDFAKNDSFWAFSCLYKKFIIQ